MSFPSYPSYRATGIDWLGDLPSHWKIAPLKRGFAVTLGKMLQPEKGSESDVLAPYLRAASIQWGGVDVSDMKRMYFSARDREKLRLQHGDLLVSEGGDVGRCCMWGDELSECYFQNSVNRVRGGAGHLTEFLRYWLMTIKASGFVDVLCNKSTIAHFTAEKLEAVPVPYPPTDEQIAIVRFLNYEVGRIDDIVRSQERLVALMKEKREALIISAVTRGNCKSCEMKDSGAEWLGSVPVHWNVKQIRYMAQVLRGKFTHRPRNDPAFYDGDYPFIQTGDITAASRYITAFRQTLNTKGAAVSKEFPRGTLVMAIAANIGDVAILDFPAYFPDSIVGLVPEKCIKLEFLYYLLIAMKPAMLQTATVSTQLNVNVDQIAALVAPCPPLEEQAAIVELLDRELAALDSLIADASRSTEKLHERRIALIAAATTGRIDVRTAASETTAAGFVMAEVN